MTNRKKSANHGKYFRARTEEKLPTRAVRAKTPENTHRLVRVFEIHQVELKLHQELNRALGELARSRERYRDLYESSPVAYVTLDQDSRILETNLTAAQMLGIHQKELLGSNFTKFVTIESLEYWCPHCRAAFSNETKQVCEIRIRRTDGSLRSLRAESTGGGYGTVQHCRTALIDISELKRAEEELQHLLLRDQSTRNELEAAIKVKNRFLSTISHELRTPLTPILGWSSLLRDKALDNAALSQGLEIIERNAKHQKRLIDDLLELSDNIAGRIHVKFRPVELPGIIDAAVDTIRCSADAKAIKIDTHFDEDARLIAGDPDRLQQMTWHLLSNAVKFTPHGGRIDVDVKKMNDHLQILVNDTGVGMPEDFLPNVFAPFCQADNTNMRGSGGLGLGLAIVKLIVDTHGGTVQVKSKEGKGTTFTIQLPVKNVPIIEEASAVSLQLAA